MKRDAYEVLGVGRDASQDDIKRSFRRVARELHPDVNRHDPEAEEKFKEAGEAYEILSDAERRSAYDRYGHEGVRARAGGASAQGFGSFSDIFEAFFGGEGDPFGRGGRAGPAQGPDAAVAVEISLDQAATGEAVEVEYERVSVCGRCRGNGAEPGTPIEQCPRCEGTGQLQTLARTAFGQVMHSRACDACGGDGRLARDPCTQCSGVGREAAIETLSVDVPAGIADEQRIRVTGGGHAGDRGGPAGDLYVLVRVPPDPRFVRDGNDLISVVDVAAPDAALGARATVPTLDGDEDVEVAPGTQPGDVLTLRGRGMPSLRRGRRGDQRVVVNVVVPRNLSSRQRELLRELADSLEEDNVRDPHGGDESLFARVKRALR